MYQYNREIYGRMKLFIASIYPPIDDVKYNESNDTLSVLLILVSKSEGGYQMIQCKHESGFEIKYARKSVGTIWDEQYKYKMKRLIGIIFNKSSEKGNSFKSFLHYLVFVTSNTFIAYL